MVCFFAGDRQKRLQSVHCYHTAAADATRHSQILYWAPSEMECTKGIVDFFSLSSANGVPLDPDYRKQLPGNEPSVNRK